MSKTIGLVMIVKNEASVIVRCLDSARPLIDYVSICDTGSTDGTQQIIRDWLETNGIPGQVLGRPWVNFAANRTESLEALRRVEAVDYALTIDADETFAVEPGIDVGALKSGLSADVYEAMVHYDGLRYRRACLFSNRMAFRYRAVLHEYLVAPAGATRALLDGIVVNVTQDGARSKNTNKFLDDAKVLEAALGTETDPLLRSRYTFYLGQSYFDAGQWQEAHDAYLRRTEMGNWIEEVYVSLIRAGRASERLGQPPEVRLALFLRAFDVVPRRAEALCEAAGVCRTMERYELGYLLASKAAGLVPPPDSLFLDSTVYRYRALDELQIAAYWTGRFDESLAVAERLLKERAYPAEQEARLVANRDFARAKVRRTA